MSGGSALLPKWPPQPNLGPYGKWWNSHWVVLFQKCVRHFDQDGSHSVLSLTYNPMGNSHTNLLFRNHWDNCNQTLVEWSLDGPLPKMCPVIPISNQDVRQAKNRKKGRWNLEKYSPLKLLSQSQPNFAEMILGWSPSKIVFGISDQDGRHSRT